jgi:hypothetical protein
VTFEANARIGVSLPVCVNEDETSRVSINDVVDAQLGFQCCADVSVAACQESCEISCGVVTEDITSGADADALPIAMSVDGLVADAVLLQAVATALVWPCDPGDAVDAIDASDGTHVRHNLDLSMVVDGALVDYPIDGPETICIAAVRGDGVTGASCGRDSDCQSGNCDDANECGPELPAGSAAFGDECESGSDCASGTCGDSTGRQLRQSLASVLGQVTSHVYNVELKETAVAAAGAGRISLTLGALLRKSIDNDEAQFSQEELDQIEQQFLDGSISSAVEQTVDRNPAGVTLVARRTEITYVQDNVALSRYEHSRRQCFLTFTPLATLRPSTLLFRSALRPFVLCSWDLC